LSYISCLYRAHVKDGFTYVHADPEELQKIRQTASSDWNSFVAARGRELKPG